MRSEKVEQLRQQVESGNYALKLGVVAANLVAAGILKDEV
ncbi:MAG: Anti-sigma-28 factor, FlgM [Synergistetes bacterium ADurb.Bin520]|nr:MAG: Anti-sigma-28 factor, FlgM [Synergistetes bacterium ADurb.Bin520]